MNASSVLTAIKSDLGIYHITLPFENPDEEIMNIIRTRTIPSYSTFYPQVIKLPVDLSKDLIPIKTDYTESVYRIPDIFGGRPLMYIRDVSPRRDLISGDTNNMSPLFQGSMDLYGSLMYGQISADLMSLAAPPITFEFNPPNILRLFNISTMYGNINIEFAVAHALNLSTIPDTAWESFLELAILDVKKFLYNTMKHYNEIQTAYGTVNLKIDDWQNADSERKDLIEKWRDSYHLETKQFFII